MNSILRSCCAAVSAVVIANLLVACGDDEDDAPIENTSGVHAVDAENESGSTPDQDGGPLGGDTSGSEELGGITGRGTASPDQPLDEVPEGMQRIMFRGLRTFVPAGWERQPPASSMRELQMRVPSEILDKPDAGFVVYGGISGTVQENIDRWVGQFTGADGFPVQPAVEDLWAGDLQIAIVELTGDYQSGMAPGESGPDMTMIQAIVETPQGEQIFIRLLGPRPVVAANRDAMRSALESLQPAQ